MLLNYWEFVKQEAARTQSDGCTGVSEWHQECCYEHDLACRFGKDPRSAYRYYCMYPDLAPAVWWSLAEPISRRRADYAFANCNVEWSTGLIGKTRSWVRFLGTRVGAFLGIGVRRPRR